MKLTLASHWESWVEACWLQIFPLNVPMSSVGWIDFSSEHREKVRTVIGLLSSPGVVDELGIGVIRDAFADAMFPGISTIQTRAKYFTLTALLIRRYQLVELRKPRARSFTKYMEEEEMGCRIALARRHHGDAQALGIIGGSFGLRTDRDVMRRASSVYWTGLRKFRFITPGHLSLMEFSRRITGDKKALGALLAETAQDRGDDPEAEDGGSGIRVQVPDVGADYWDNLSIDLTREEADFLRERIRIYQPGSLLGCILDDDAAMDEVLELPEGAGFPVFSERPFIRRLRDKLLRDTVDHARLFWTIMEGAHIRYNCLLQARFGKADTREELHEYWEDWRRKISTFPREWDTEFMWSTVSRQGGRAGDSTRAFINGWIDQARQGARDLVRCDELVIRQECTIKRSRARLRPGNQQSYEDWIGLERIEYRLPQVRQLIRDIHQGGALEGGAIHA
jgi:hypothetical protein